jgi:hypothetical protein
MAIFPISLPQRKYLFNVSNGALRQHRHRSFSTISRTASRNRPCRAGALPTLLRWTPKGA